MGLLGMIDTKTKVNTPLLVILSLIPFVCIYSFLRIKKTRKMLLVNLVTILIFVIYLILRYDLANQGEQVLSDIRYMNYIIIPIIDGLFVWKWSREWNRKIENT